MPKGYKIPNLLAPKVWAGSVDFTSPAAPVVNEFYSDFEGVTISVSQIVTGRFLISSSADIFIDGKTIMLCSLPLLNSIIEGYITGFLYLDSTNYVWRFYDSTGTETDPCISNVWLLKFEIYP